MNWQTFYAKYNIPIWAVIFFGISVWVMVSYMRNVAKIKRIIEDEQDRLRKKKLEGEKTEETTDAPSEKSE